jgi:hypothetical protein
VLAGQSSYADHSERSAAANCRHPPRRRQQRPAAAATTTCAAPYHSCCNCSHHPYSIASSLPLIVCSSLPQHAAQNKQAKAFTDHYYATFDTARANLSGLYQEQSMLTFEGQKFLGTQAVRFGCVAASVAVTEAAGPCPGLGSGVEQRCWNQWCAHGGSQHVGAVGQAAGWSQLPAPCSLHSPASSPLPQHTCLLRSPAAHSLTDCLAASIASLQILGKLTSLPFQQCKHHISSLDAQPSLSSGVLVFVTGQLLVSHRAQAPAAAAAVSCCCCYHLSSKQAGCWKMQAISSCCGCPCSWPGQGGLSPALHC